MNLIEQQNILRGLSDDQLSKEMNSGSVPPYLVLSEVSRRKTARERYEAAVAKRGGGTVAEELMGKAAPKGLDAAIGTMGANAPSSGGLDAAMPQEPQLDPMPQQAYANGGVVGYADGGLADLVKAYNSRVSGMDEDRAFAQKMALMNIGAQIMAGRSRNTLSNVGAGLSAALPGYQQSMTQLNNQEMQAMRDQIDLARMMQQDELAADDRAYNRQRDLIVDKQREDAAMPVDVREALWLETATPEQRAAYEDVQKNNTAVQAAKAASAYRAVEGTARRAFIGSDGLYTSLVPETLQDRLNSGDPAAQIELQKLIRQKAIDDFRYTYPDYASYADEYAKQLDGQVGAPLAPSTGFNPNARSYTDLIIPK